ncbi:MAG: glycosyltransferase, partial [Solirubrobacteraceae bacterium]
LEAWAYARAAAIAVPTAGISRALERHPAAAGRVERIGPAVDTRRFAGVPPPQPRAPLEVLYAGTVGLAQGIDTLVSAARLAGPDGVRLTIAGGGAEAERVRRLAADHVTWRGIAPAAEVPALYGAAHAGVVLLRDRPVFDGAVPTKLLECMAAGRAVVLSAGGEAAELVRRTGVGVVVPPEDAAALAAAFRSLAADPAGTAEIGARGRRAAAEEFDRAGSADRWTALLARVAC